MQPKRCIDWGDQVPAMKNFCLNCNTLSVHSFTLKVFVLIFSMLSLLLPYQHHTHTDAISAFLPRLLMSHRLTVPVTPTICKDLLINCRTKHRHPTFTGIYNICPAADCLQPDIFSCSSSAYWIVQFYPPTVP